MTTRTWTLNGDDWAVVKPVTSGILSRAELLLLNDDFSLSSPMWPDRSGNSHHGQLGSAAGSDTNDPVTLKKGTDGKYVWLPGVAPNSLTTPHSAALDITGDIDIRAKVSLPDLTPPAQMTFVNKYASNAGYYLAITTTGYPQLVWGVSGGALIATSTVPLATHGTEADEVFWLRATLDVDNGASGYEANFYTSADGASWSQVGAAVTGGATTAIDTNSTPVSAGDQDAGPHSIYAVQIYDGIDGTLVLDVNLADATEPYATFTERANDATVTINRSASGYVSTVVDRGTRVFSTDDYVEVADQADLDFADDEDFTLFAVVASQTFGANDRIVSKRDGGGAGTGYGMYYFSASGDVVGAVEDTTTAQRADISAASTAGQRYVYALRRDESTPDVEVYVDGVGTGSPSVGASADLTNAENLYIGSTHTPAAFFEGEIMAVALFREALTDEEILLVSETLAAVPADAVGLHQDALQVWLKKYYGWETDVVSHEVVGMLNQLNGTTGVGYRKARAVFLGLDYP